MQREAVAAFAGTFLAYVTVTAARLPFSVVKPAITEERPAPFDGDATTVLGTLDTLFYTTSPAQRATSERWSESELLRVRAISST